MFVYLQNQNELDDIATVGVFFYAVKGAVRPTQQVASELCEKYEQCRSFNEGTMAPDLRIVNPQG